MNILIRGANLFDPDRFRIKERDIYLENGLVRYDSPMDRVDHIFDAHGQIALPALTIGHHHIYSALSKGVPCDVPFGNFLGNLKNLWWTLDRSLETKDMMLSTVLTAQQCLQNGVTTIFDHHVSAQVNGVLSKMAAIFKEYCLAGSIAFELSDRNGQDFFARSLAENINFAESGKYESVKGMIGMHASFTLSDESLQTIADKTGDHPIHIHIAEAEIDVLETKKRYGCTPVQRLDRFGLLRPNSILVHCSNLEENDIKILKNRDIYIVQAVDSNMKNGLNVGNIHKFINAGIKTTVGTDGMHSNALKAMKNSMLMTNYLNQSPDLGYAEMEALLKNNYRLKETFGLPLGIREGEPADIAIFDYEAATPLNDDTFLAHFIFAITESRCRFLFKQDKILLEDYHITIDPYPELKKEAAEISKKLFEKFKQAKQQIKSEGIYE
jgi:cytosine/adenosine deaminase-related metal-dependent hydrolase